MDTNSRLSFLAAARPRAPVEPAAWRATVPGTPVGRDEVSEIAILRGLPRLVRTQRARLWLRRALTELLNRRPNHPMRGRLALSCRAWSSDGRALCDDTLIGDALERAAILADRRQIGEVHLAVGCDAKRPRVEIRLLSLAAEAAP